MHTMVFKLALFCNLLLASVALAVPSSRRRRQNQLNNTNNVAGIVVTGGNNESFSGITGTFTVPTSQGADGGFSVFIGIGGDACQDTVLQTGVEVDIANGVPSYKAWYEYSSYFDYLPSISIRGGDVIMAYVFANTTTSIGSAIIHNLSIRQIVSIDFEFSQPLCDYIAEWLVEDYMEGSNLISFANFGNVQFTSAIAFGAIRYNYSPSDGDIFNIQQNSQLLTSVTIDTGNSVLVQYI